MLAEGKKVLVVTVIIPTATIQLAISRSMDLRKEKRGRKGGECLVNSPLCCFFFFFEEM